MQRSSGGGEGSGLRRREALGVIAGLGIGTVAFRRALAVSAVAAGQVTEEMIRDAEWIAGIELDDEERQGVARGLSRALRDVEALRDVPLGNDVPPALLFRTAESNAPPPATRRDTPAPPGEPESPPPESPPTDSPPPGRPASDEDLAFLSVAEVSRLLRTRRVSAVELAKLSLERLRRHDPELLCVVSYTEDIALEQAERADRELAAGKRRGPLHGVPWGAKDLMAYPGTRTTWGATPYRDQVIDATATVARRLDEAGAVMVAKLSLGALAMGDRWFRGMTRNPWNTEQGSSGSSAGSASATAAGLVGFAIGTETLGSIVSPCTRCGVTGLRPTFGRVSRHGCMALAWSMDKVGPIARTVEDCALVFAAIHGADGLDPAAVDRPFDWPPARSLRDLRVGFFGDMEGSRELAVLREIGVQLVPFELPDGHPVEALRLILDAEAAASFDALTREGITEGLNAWPGIFRRARFTTAVDYIRANRVRRRLMDAMERAMERVDAYVDVRRRDLTLTNFTGHPTVVLPNGFRNGRDGVEVPTSITFTGRLFGETDLLSVARAYQKATGFHRRRPPLG